MVGVAGSGAPSSVENIPADPGDGLIPTGAVTGRLADVRFSVTRIRVFHVTCGSLVGAIVLIKRDNCDFSVKELMRRMLAQWPSSSTCPTPLAYPSGRTVGRGNSGGDDFECFRHGADLRAAANPSSQATLDPAGIEQNATPDQVAIFSSGDPPPERLALKPDLLGIGENIYMASQSYDFAGELYSSRKYVLADGTSFSTPMVAGAAALVKQRHPNWTAAQIKSALANTAASTVQTDEAGNRVDNRSFGGGPMDVGNCRQYL